MQSVHSSAAALPGASSFDAAAGTPAAGSTIPVATTAAPQSVTLAGNAGPAGDGFSTIFQPAGGPTAAVGTDLLGTTLPATTAPIVTAPAVQYAPQYAPQYAAAPPSIPVATAPAVAYDDRIIAPAAVAAESAYSGIFGPSATEQAWSKQWNGSEFGISPQSLASVQDPAKVAQQAQKNTAAKDKAAAAKGKKGGKGAKAAKDANTPPGAGDAAATGEAPGKKASKAEMVAYIKKVAKQTGVNEKMLVAIAQKESNFKATVANNWDSNAKKGTPSKGLFQFIKPTFDSYAKSAKKANPKAWAELGPLNWMDWRQQTLAAAWAIKNGKGSAWATFGAAKAAAGM